MQGKVIALTGGASGIGLSASKILSSRGATVCIADVDPTALSSTEAHFSSQSVPFMITKVDVSKRSEVDTWIRSIVQKYGRLDGAANCAGIIGKHHGIKTIAETEDEEWDKIMAVNLTGMFYCLRAELGAVVNGGSIVNVASIQGVMGFAKHGAYVASKHGVIGLTRTAAKEVGARNIRVNALAPGAIQTPLMVKADAIQNNPVHDEPSAIKRMGTPDEMGYVIAFLLSHESSFVTGMVYGADGGWAC
jgi:NAD(P)-dependent dehydrogenase (short-subunit alcohol dehydrogenase family)